MNTQSSLKTWPHGIQIRDRLPIRTGNFTGMLSQRVEESADCGFPHLHQGLFTRIQAALLDLTMTNHYPSHRLAMMQIFHVPSLALSASMDTGVTV
ncbi:MAG: hypothetical protein ABW101_01180 [Candidatus Thiodiazotropha sp.]